MADPFAHPRPDGRRHHHGAGGQKATCTARRKEAYEALHPETRHGGDRKSDQVANLATRSFADDQAAKTGQSARAIRRDAERGQQVCQEALDILKGTKADTGVDSGPKGTTCPLSTGMANLATLFC